MAELREFVRSWWSRGGGAAVLALLVVVVVFRAPRDGIFWAAIAFFVIHTGLAVWRYLRGRRNRATVAVTQVHLSEDRVPVIFSPLPVNSIVVDLTIKTPTRKAS